MKTEELLAMWVVYDRPRDSDPSKGRYVVRKWEIRAGEVHPTSTALQTDNLIVLREILARTLVRIPRLPGDDPVIVECWA
jgi:hypothetical protein